MSTRTSTRSAATRTEHYLLGDREVPADAYHGVQTLRAVENFPISGVKMGRTQLQDAVSMTLGQEFAAYAVVVGESIQHLRLAADDLLTVNMGAAAIDTGIKAGPRRCRDYVENSIGLATALNPVLGYERAAAIAGEALASGERAYDLILHRGWLGQQELDERLRPENLIRPVPWMPVVIRPSGANT